MIKKLPYKTFLETFKLVPRVAINILIWNNLKQVLLTKRSIPPFKDFWHMPGSFLLKGETLSDCLNRIAQKEIGIILKKKNIKLLGIFEDIENDPRGHVVDIVYGYRLIDEPNFYPKADTKELKFFEKLPSKIGFNHKKTLLEIIGK